jgi:hypothetical protein
MLDIYSDSVDIVDNASKQMNLEMRNKQTNWLGIAETFAYFQRKFVGHRKIIEFIRVETKISKCNTTKLLKIGNSDRIIRHRYEFGKVHCLNVLYAITTLNDEQFNALIYLANDGNAVTGSLVAKAKAGKWRLVSE